jgi:hypothetical protein
LTVEATKILPLEMIGVAPLGPGKGRTQAIFSLSLQEAGRLVSSVEPLKKGPRHCGQSVAKAGSVGARSRAVKQTTGNHLLMQCAPIWNERLAGIIHLRVYVHSPPMDPVIQKETTAGPDPVETSGRRIVVASYHN